jgi:hypothetical protein
MSSHYVHYVARKFDIIEIITQTLSRKTLDPLSISIEQTRDELDLLFVLHWEFHPNSLVWFVSTNIPAKRSK